MALSGSRKPDGKGFEALELFAAAHHDKGTGSPRSGL